MSDNSQSSRKVFAKDPQSALLAEYQSLRSESIQIGQVISTTLWVAVSSYGVTGSAGLAILKYLPNMLTILLGLLCVQSLAASLMFLANIFKYVRIGSYIRKHVESRLIQETGDRLLNWEGWVEKRRPKWYYVVSFLILQSPIFCAICVPLLGLADVNVPAVLTISLTSFCLTTIFACWVVYGIWRLANE